MLLCHVDAVYVYPFSTPCSASLILYLDTKCLVLSRMATKSPDIIQQYLSEVEEAAEEVMTTQQEVVTLDRRRNTNREALRNLCSNTAVSATARSGGRSWICVGNMFLRMPREFVVESIEKGMIVDANILFVVTHV